MQLFNYIYNEQFVPPLQIIKMKILSVLAVCAYCVSAEKIKIGELKNLHHGVSGSVFAIDDNTIAIENFNYDGAGSRTNNIT